MTGREELGLELGAGGAAAVISSALGKIEQQVETVVREQVKQRDLLTRFDERQRGWATKHEVTELSYKVDAALAPVAAQAQAAHTRLDTTAGKIDSLAEKIESLDGKVDALVNQGTVRDAEQRGTWRVVLPVLRWTTGIAAVVMAAFLVGRYVGQ